MGREIRRVPPNWEHPKVERYGRTEYQPMFDRDYKKEKQEWIDGLMAWENKTDPDYDPEYEWWEWNGNPPDREYYVPYDVDDPSCTWFQVYETVSEGTPVSPPFESEDELIDYLTTKGDFWDQRRGHGPWSLESATKFVKGSGWRPSMMVGPEGVKMARDMED